MRFVPTLAFAALLLALPARAEVDVDLGALDQLAPAKPAPPKPAAKPAVKQAAKPNAPAAKAEQPAPPPPAPVIVPPKAAAEAAPPAPPAPAVIEMPVAPKQQSASLDRGAAQRPTSVPTLPTLADPTAPETPPPVPPTPVSHTVGTIQFAAGTADLSPDAKKVLSTAAERLAGDERLHLELLAYAMVQDPSLARRLSLSRALAARAYLVEQGVRTQRIDLRPLGAADESRGDRIELRLARH